MTNSKKNILASVFCVSLVWTVCSALVALFPDAMLQITAHMFHIDMSQIEWTLSWAGFLSGLLGWVILVGGTVGLFSAFFNNLAEK